MPSILLHPSTDRNSEPDDSILENPLPQLLQTPSGLAIIELQGTINMPSTETSDILDDNQKVRDQETSIGRIVFPEYSTTEAGNDTSWMKRVYMYVGQHQRLTGEVRKLAKPLAVIWRRQQDGDSDQILETAEELEVVQIIHYKILFPSRPEPVGN